MAESGTRVYWRSMLSALRRPSIDARAVYAKSTSVHVNADPALVERICKAVGGRRVCTNQWVDGGCYCPLVTAAKREGRDLGAFFDRYDQLAREDDLLHELALHFGVTKDWIDGFTTGVDGYDKPWTLDEDAVGYATGLAVREALCLVGDAHHPR